MARASSKAMLVWLQELEGTYLLEYSPRLRSSLGRCLPERSLVRLQPRLLTDLAHLHPEVVCHELAHLEVFRRHGPEWQALVREAGYEPRRLALVLPPTEAILHLPSQG